MQIKKLHTAIIAVGTAAAKAITQMILRIRTARLLVPILLAFIGCTIAKNLQIYIKHISVFLHTEQSTLLLGC